jgi:hypothetical protein
MRQYLRIFYIIILFTVISTEAYAYLDPGTGSMILQAIIGAVAAFFTAFYIFWNKVKFFFINIFNKIFKRKKEEKNGQS